MKNNIIGRLGLNVSLAALLTASTFSSPAAAQQDGQPVSIFGVRPMPLGGASLTIDSPPNADQKLKISNLGSSGQDGVSIVLPPEGAASMLIELDEIVPNPNQDGSVVTEFFGTVAGGPPQKLVTYTSSSRFDPITGDTDWHTTADFSPIGSQTNNLMGMDFGTQKFEFADISSSFGTGTKASAGIIYFTADDGTRICSMGSKPVVVTPAIVNGGGGGPGVGIEEAVTVFDFSPFNPTGRIDTITSMTMKFTDVGDVFVTGIQSEHLGAFVTGVDTAQVETTQGGKLKISNLGSSGCDGVSIDAGGPGVTGVHAAGAEIAIDLTSSGAPIAPGAFFSASVDARLGDSPDKAFMGVDVSCASAIQPDIVEWTCSNSNLPFVWIVDGSENGVEKIVADPAASTFEVSGFFPNLDGVFYGTGDDGDLGLSLTFAQPVTLFVDGNPHTIDTLTLSIDASVAWQVTELDELHIQTQTLPSFEIGAITSGATPFKNLGATLNHGHVTVLKSPLSGGGVLGKAGDLAGLMLRDAPAGAPSILFIGGASNPVPFKGGTLLPVPAILQLQLPTSANGELTLPFAWPAGIPSGFELVFQYAVQDALAPKGVWLSNGLLLTTP